MGDNEMYTTILKTAIASVAFAFMTTVTICQYATIHEANTKVEIARIAQVTAKADADRAMFESMNRAAK